MKFKDKKLAPTFDGQIHYYFEKLSEGCHGNSDRRAFASMHVDLLIEMVAKFRTALTERGVLPAYDNLRHEVEDTEYPLQELKKYFDGAAANTLNEKSSFIFTFFLKHQIELLSRAAAEIDADYEAETE